MRAIPEETPVALTYERATLAVMLAKPADLEDFALAFSLTEGIVERPEQIEELTIFRLDAGLELRMWLAAARSDIAETRRRHLAGPQRLRPVRPRKPRGGEPPLPAGDLDGAVRGLRDRSGHGGIASGADAQSGDARSPRSRILAAGTRIDRGARGYRTAQCAW
jgi:hypothetical protein